MADKLHKYEFYYLNVWFNLELSRSEIIYFRGAVSKLAGPNHILFHNHIDDKKFLYRYPLIQYKIVSGVPMLVCIKEGIEEVRFFFEKLGDTIDILGDKKQISVRNLSLRLHRILMVPKPFFNYKLIKWLPFNDKNWKEWNNVKSPEERKKLLSKILVGNVLSMAKGVGWFVEDEILVDIQGWKGPLPVRYKENICKHFLNVYFKINVKLPYYIGLGKGSSFGFGTLLPA